MVKLVLVIAPSNVCFRYKEWSAFIGHILSKSRALTLHLAFKKSCLELRFKNLDLHTSKI